MIFMLAATLTSLILTIINKIKAMVLLTKTPDFHFVKEMLSDSKNAFFWGNWFQLIFAIAMTALAVILVIEGVQTFTKQCKESN